MASRQASLLQLGPRSLELELRDPTRAAEAETEEVTAGAGAVIVGAARASCDNRKQACECSKAVSVCRNSKADTLSGAPE